MNFLKAHTFQTVLLSTVNLVHPYTVVDYPSLVSAVYGQRLQDAKCWGGSAKDKEGVEVPGEAVQVDIRLTSG